ncbi:MAG: flippase-like domain-containing protein [Flavobacteriales bacterium]|nr:flippase-like domain-containing protein [Flavobacteriales bacterium]
MVLGLGVAIWMLVSSLNKRTYVEALPGEKSLYAWTDTNGNGLVDKADKNEFRFEPDGGYVLKSARQLILEVHWDIWATLAIAGALLMLLIRDLGYIYRIRAMTDKQLSWRQSFEVIMLWEFASAMTPSVVGGSGIAMFIINREGINMGRSTAITFVTAMLDEIFYIIMVPVVFLIIGEASLFPEVSFGDHGSNKSIKIIFFLGYFFIMFLTVIILIGVFWRPNWFKNTLVWLTSFRLLRSLKRRAARVGDEIITCSQELRGKPWTYWARSFTATCVSWTARFFTLNFIIMAFVPKFDHWLVIGRQLIMWVIMLVAPTPGGSGVAEYSLSVFFNYLIPLGIVAVVAIIWRFLTYFPYLFMGVFILPRWLKRTAALQTNGGSVEPS